MWNAILKDQVESMTISSSLKSEDTRQHGSQKTEGLKCMVNLVSKVNLLDSLICERNYFSSSLDSSMMSQMGFHNPPDETKLHRTEQ